MATFKPKNRKRYTGKFGRFVLSKAGQPCTVLGRYVTPAEHTRGRKPLTRLMIRFHDSSLDVYVMPQDVEETT